MSIFVKIVVMEEDKNKVYKTYKSYLEEEELNILQEPEAVYATSFNDMVAVTNYDKNYAADLLDVSYKTITRYQKEKKKLSPLQSEFVLKTIALHNKGEKLFGSSQSFENWLNKPSFGMDGHVPNTFITTVTGINHIIDELNRIAHGDLA
jgi:putative toxin-antitoxin system antitoxin component (TIGR02293 family)